MRTLRATCSYNLEIVGMSTVASGESSERLFGTPGA
jgi:hypothetical protein